MLTLGLQLYYKVPLTQVFSFEFYEISKNTFFTEHLRWLLLYANTVFSIKMRGFEIVKDPEAYSEICRTSNMKIFKK